MDILNVFSLCNKGESFIKVGIKKNKCQKVWNK